MRAQRTSATAPEAALRRVLRLLGARPAPGRLVRLPGGGRTTPDIVLPGHVAVYVHGCYWHGCDLHARAPKTNTLWWVRKLARNRYRDRRHTEGLAELGWLPLVVWEHEDPHEAAADVLDAVRARVGRWEARA